MATNTPNSLQAVLEDLPTGELRGDARVKALSLLETIWLKLDGNKEGGMQPSKLQRVEALEWHPPVLSFRIERHGGTVLGSSRAELQQWEVNVCEFAATIVKSGHRQLSPMNPPVKAQPIAEEIIAIILEGEQDPRITWKSSDEVRVKIGQFIPDDAPKQTVSGRRRKVSRLLTEALSAKGWQQTKDWTFTRDRNASSA